MTSKSQLRERKRELAAYFCGRPCLQAGLGTERDYDQPRSSQLSRGISCRSGPGNDGVAPFPFHHLQHSFAVNYLKTPRLDGSPASIYMLSKHLGHTSVKTTEIYLDYLSAAEQQAVMVGRSGYDNGYGGARAAVAVEVKAE